MKTENSNSYPIQFIDPILLKDGTIVQLRPIHPIDGQQAEYLKTRISAENLYNRFLGYIPTISEALVKQMTQIDYSKEMAIVAEVKVEGKKEIIAVARLGSDGSNAAEFAIVIIDDWHGKGLGTVLTDYMIEVAKAMKFDYIYALFFDSNKGMKRILEKRHFKIDREDANIMRADLMLSEDDFDIELDIQF
ncbi:MAG: GNAT family N-acetyltransferase [Bacteroidota bacterium]